MSQNAKPEQESNLPFLFSMALCLGGLIVHALSYLPFMTDDAYISLRYAKRLLQGNGLTWTAGETVEGYTNFLWVIATAALGIFQVDLVSAARILGLLCMAAALIAAMFCVRNSAGEKPWAGWTTGLGFALAGPIAVWAVGGLEQPLLVALLAWVFYLLFRQINNEETSTRQMILPGLLLGLICLTRADGALFTVAVILAWIAARGINKETTKLAAFLAAISFACFAGHLIFRLGYYGQWVPNTALIKTQFSTDMVFRGIKYLVKGLLYMSPLLAFAFVALLSAVKDKALRPKVVFLAIVGMIWGGYVVLIGGDYFVAHRHLTPLVLVVAILAGFGLRAAGGRVGLLIIAVLLMVAYGFLQLTAPANTAARKQRWEANGEVVGKMLNKAFVDMQPLMAVTAAGSLPYYAELPALDMLGLNDRHIAQNPPDDLESYKPAHQFGDGDYVLSRKPDLVVFCEPGGCIEPNYRSGIEMVKDPQWQMNYRLVYFEGRDPFVYGSKIYVRAEDGRIGIERNENLIEVPGFLFAGNPKSIARMDNNNRIVTVVEKGMPAKLSGLKAPKGNWTFTVSATKPVYTSLKIAGTSAMFQSDSEKLQFELGATAAIDLAIYPKSEGETFIHEVVIQRAEKE